MSFNKKFFTTGGIVASSEAVCNTDSKYAFGADSSFTSNIALYQLDGDGGVANNVPDTTTNYNGTSSNVTYSTGQFGNAAVFNGSSAYIDTGGDLVNSFTAITVAGWFYTEPNTNYSYGLHFGTIGSDGDAISISRWNNTASGGFGAYTLYSNIGSSSIDGNFTLNEDTWYHIAISYTGTTLKFYVNGNLETTATVTSLSIPASGNSGYIGRFISNQSYNWKGNIDQVRIFDRVISDSEVATLYAETSATASSINPLNEGQGVALYNLDYDASDAGGLYDGTPTDVTFGVGGQINYGARFNGSSSKIDLPDILPANSNADSSFTCWFRTSDTSGNQMTIVNAWNGSTTANNGGWALFKDAGNTFFFTQYYLKSNASGLTGSTALGDGNWHFIAVVFDYSAGTLSLYLDGNSTPHLQHTSLTPGTVNIFNGGAELGYQKAGGPFRYWNGDIDQVRIFSSALDSDQVSQLYAEEACVYTSTTDQINYPTDNVAYYKLDGSAEDSHGNTYDGTASNITYEFGRYGQAAVFNGSSSRIDINSLATVLDGQNIVSTSLWFKSTSTSLSGLFSYRGSASSAVNMLVTINRSATGDIGIDSSTSSAFVNLGTYNGGYNDGNWHHVVSVINYTTGAFNVYIDNTLRITGTNASISRGTADKVQLGANYSSQYLNGSLDQVRIFSTALTDVQVSQLYNEKQDYITKDAADPFGDSSEFAFYKFDNNANDSSGSNNGIVSGANFSTTDPVRGTHNIHFDGINDKVDGFSEPVFFNRQSYSASIWVKPDSATGSGRFMSEEDTGGSAVMIRPEQIIIDARDANTGNATTDILRLYYTLTAGIWNHICLVNDALHYYLYLNGDLITDSNFGKYPTSGGQFGFGARVASSDAYFGGEIDHTRLFNRALDGTEVYQLYAEGARGTGL